MLSITIPLWLLLSAAGLPALILIGLCARLLRMKRRHEALAAAVPLPQAAPPAPTGFDDRIHRQVLDQQIDAVFDVLKTLIETERCKLKALVNHALPVNETISEAPVAPIPEEKSVEAPSVEAPRMDTPVSETAEAPLSQSIANLAEEGLAAAEIAKRLGISFSEVNLALKMKVGRNSHLGRKVMAVA